MNKILLFFTCCFCGILQAQNFKTGVTIDSIPVANSDQETFALYLPKTYDPNKLSPILFIFSPSGNGKNGISHFVNASETFNYILVCSNNSRNGPYDYNLAIAQRLFSHVFANFNIKEKNIYLAGFSGGSRLVTAIASLSGQIAGVIACGAGFAEVPSYAPSTQLFSYAGICGNRDMNYQEMINVSGYLDRLKFNNTLFTFDGNHRWPPNEQILMAVDWLEMEAHKNGSLKRSPSEIEKSYSKSFAIAETAEKNSKLLPAVENYERIIHTYRKYVELDTIRQRVATLKKGKPYNKTLKSRQKALAKEEVLSPILLDRFTKDYQQPEKANLKWWNKEFDKLDKLDANGDAEMQKMVDRMQFRLFAVAYERYNPNIVKSGDQQREFCKTIVSRLYPKFNPQSSKKKN